VERLFYLVSPCFCAGLLPGDFRTRDGASGPVPFGIGFEDEEGSEAAKNSADLFLMNMRKRRRKLFTKMSAGEEDFAGGAKVNEYDDDDTI